MLKKLINSGYWDTIVRKSCDDNHEDLWRAHMKEVYEGLMNRWLDSSNGGLTLKTDLYDEAITKYNLISLFGNQCEHIIGTDASFEVALNAKRRLAKELKGWQKRNST